MFDPAHGLAVVLLIVSAPYAFLAVYRYAWVLFRRL